MLPSCLALPENGGSFQSICLTCHSAEHGGMRRVPADGMVSACAAALKNEKTSGAGMLRTHHADVWNGDNVQATVVLSVT